MDPELAKIGYEVATTPAPVFEPEGCLSLLPALVAEAWGGSKGIQMDVLGPAARRESVRGRASACCSTNLVPRSKLLMGCMRLESAGRTWCGCVACKRAWQCS